MTIVIIIILKAFHNAGFVHCIELGLLGIVEWAKEMLNVLHED